MPATIATKSNRATSLKDITNAALRFLVGFRNVATMGLKQGSTPAAVVTAAASAYTYIVDGVFTTLTGSAASNWLLDLATTYNYKAITAVTGVTQYTTFVLCNDATGTSFIASQGPIVAAAADMTLGDIPAGYTPVGYVKIAVTSTNVFTPGTTSLTGTGVTATFVNCEVLPSGTL